MKAWITKYALTNGIIETEGETNILGNFLITEGLYKNKWFSSDDCFANKESAIRKSEEMRQKKIESLKKQIKKLEGMRFE